MYADAEMLIRRFERAVAEARSDLRISMRKGGMSREEIESYRTLFDRVMPEAQRVMRRVVFDYNEAIPSQSRITPEVVQTATRVFRDVLDLAPPGKSALTAFRPMWPMTLAQLEAQVAERDAEPRTNPAPLFQKDKVAKNTGLNFGSTRAVYGAQKEEPAFAAFVAAEPRTGDWTALDGIAWDLSMPEGFPPYPRRGGVYSKHEAAAIHSWLRNFWPVTREVFALAQKRDNEITRAGISPDRVQRIFQGIGSLTRWIEDYRYRSRDFPDAEGKTPKEFHADTLAWAVRLLESVRALEEITPAMFQRQSDPDEHVRQVEGNGIMRGNLRGIAHELYGLSRHSSDWLRKLTDYAYASDPADFISADPAAEGRSRKTYLLSTLLDAQAQADAAYAARRAAEEAATQRAIVVARNALRPLVEAGRPFTRAAIQSALPTFTLDVRDRYKPVHVSLRSPDAFVTYGSGPTLTAALADLRKNVGL